MPFGYNGKILWVDLYRKGIAVEEPDEHFYRTYGGGACLGAYYLLKKMGPGVHPFSCDNIIVFAGSVVNGAPIPGFARSAIAFKSPRDGGKDCQKGRN